MPKPIAAPGELLIRVKACGICGSDVHGYDGSTGRRFPPIIMGHEAAGVVEEIGEGVEGFQAGDRVTFDSTVYCGQCFFCMRGQVDLCDRREVIGVSTPTFRRMGTFAEYVVVPARIAYLLPEELPFADAAMIEAVSVAVHAVSLTQLSLDSTVVVVGAGMIGLLTLQAAKLAGAGRVFVMDIDQNRLDMAMKLGATGVLRSADAQAAISAVQMQTMGYGTDVAFECVGTTATIELAVESVRKGGSVTLVGNVSPKIELGLQSVVTKQIRLQGSCASSGEYPACIALMSRGAIVVEPLISARVPLHGGAEWFGKLYAREPGLLKVILEP